MIASGKSIPDPEHVKQFCKKGELQLQSKTYKNWFMTRAHKNAHSHYYNTGAEVKSNNIIDDMFEKLD